MKRTTLIIKNNIRFYRRLNDLSRKELGLLIGRTSRHIGNMEQGDVVPPLDVALLLSKIFSIPLDELFFEPAAEPEQRLVRMNPEYRKILRGIAR